MSRIRLVASVAMVACGLMLVGGAGVASAQTAPRLTKTVKLTGNKGFKNGKFTIERFTSKGEQLYAVGKVTGTLKGKKVSKSNVKIPASLVPTAQASQLPTIPGACQILNLVLGPIDLNLLGLRVRTNQINVRIDAVPGAGNLLGNLLCGITGILNPTGALGQLTGALNQLTAALNAILALVPTNPGTAAAAVAGR